MAPNLEIKIFWKLAVVGNIRYDKRNWWSFEVESSKSYATWL